MSEGNIPQFDGELYENTKDCWQKLNTASRHARYLGLVDPENIVDRRNPNPRIHYGQYLGPPTWTYEVETNHLDRIHPSLGNSRFFSPLAEVETEVEGYMYDPSLQEFHVEVWCEKTTMDDILIPACDATNTNYVSGAGYQSITAMISLLRERVARMQNPCRVLYVSDYDAAGENMPKQMARQMQFWIDKYAADYDIRVEPIVLTAEQAAGYPARPEDGAVELDAMEAIDPGKLRRIVRDRLGQFIDEDLQEKTYDTGREAEEIVEEAAQEAIAPELQRIEEIKAEAEEIYTKYRPQLENLAAQLNEELAPLDAQVEMVQQAITEKLEELAPGLPPLPGAETRPDDEGWLFDSRREYLEQLDYYKDR